MPPPVSVLDKTTMVVREPKPRVTDKVVLLARYAGVATSSSQIESDQVVEHSGSDSFLESKFGKARQALKAGGPKYEIHVAYLGKKTAVRGASGVKVRKVLCGEVGSIDCSNSTTEFSRAQVISAQRLLVSSKVFDLELFDKVGGIFNPHFWEFNLDWCLDPESPNATDFE